MKGNKMNPSLKNIVLPSRILTLVMLIIAASTIQSQKADACNCICIVDDKIPKKEKLGVPQAFKGDKYYIGYTLNADLCVYNCRWNYDMGYGGECTEGNYNGLHKKAKQLL